MKHPLSRFGLVLVAVTATLFSVAYWCHPVASAQQPVAVAPASPAVGPQSDVSVADLEAQAYKAIRAGEFDHSSDLLTQAANVSKDPQVMKMAQWTRDFESQRETFAAERRKQFDKSVADVHLLLDHGMKSYAIDEAARAYLLADNKEEFRHEKWVDDLVTDASSAADRAEDAGLWLKALRIYSDLGSLEPCQPGMER